MAALIMMSGLTAQLRAQTLTTLWSFIDDGWHSNPAAGLLLFRDPFYGNLLYGTSGGVPFYISTDGTVYSSIDMWSDFSPGPLSGFVVSPNEAYPEQSQFFAVSPYSGLWEKGGGGVLFKCYTQGSLGLSYAFDPTGVVSGNRPFGTLVLSSNRLYGTTYSGGIGGGGTVYAINTDGSAFTNLHFFSTNDASSGSGPMAGLVLSGNTLYGTTTSAGSSTNGTVFALNTDGTGFKLLYRFTGGDDGSYPVSGLAVSSNILYGTTVGGPGNGTVYKLNTDGSGFTTLYRFSATDMNGTNSDGSYPQGGVIVSGNILYGTAANGGACSNGTVFQLKTDGSSFSTLHTFSAFAANDARSTNIDGANPKACVLLLDNALYGTAFLGGGWGAGTVFCISLPQPPQLTISSAGTNVILSWPTNFIEYTLQSTTDPASPFWTTNLPSPLGVNGQSVVTNPISGTQQFFRLSQQP
jgi:uncharacterized repeat protein (TIGR03803 family)